MAHYFTDSEKQHIQQAAEKHLLDVIQDFQSLEAPLKGYDYRGECPVCHNRTFAYNPKKGFFGCFNKCPVGGKDAITYLMKVQAMGYADALQYLADRFNILLDEPAASQHTETVPQPKRESKELQGQPRDCFCTRMLTESGLTYQDLKIKVYDTDEHRTVTETFAFEKGTVNQKGEIDPSGDDAIIKYYDLKGLPVKYERKDAKGKPTGQYREYFRVRWQFPDEHLDKQGKPFKYKSPYGGGTPVYIPDKVRQAYSRGDRVDTLYIQEGEKKAEKACKHGILSMAISGIQNIATNGKLPHDMVEFITVCRVRSVVFLMDSDFNDLSHNLRLNEQVEKRPCNFYFAARNFRDYMRSLANRDLAVEAYIGHTLRGQNGEKGIDDLLAGQLAGHEQELADDLVFAANEKSLKGKYVQLYRISGYTDYKLKTIWGLESVRSFAAMHLSELKGLPEFRFGSTVYRINEKGEVELSQPLDNNEKFWEPVEKNRRDGSTYTAFEYRYMPAMRFLENRGFGRYLRMDGSFFFVREEAPFVRVINALEPRDFLFNFAKNNCPEAVCEMLVKGVTQYAGPDKMSMLQFLEPNFPEPNDTEQYLYFEDNCWRVSAASVEEMGYERVSHHVWADQRRNAKVAYLGVPLVRFTGKDDDISYTLSEQGKKCHFLQFLINTSDFSWRKPREEVTSEDLAENRMHLLSKMCAIGYMAMSYKDPSVNRAVIAMDGKQSESGTSNGRSGKSLIGVLMKNILPTAYLNGKRRDLLEDNFVWNDIDEKTRLVFIDDVLMGFNFEHLFPNLTGDWTVNYKGGRRITFPYRQSPKIYISTNHAIKGDSSSFTDRQWLLGFSDFYNEEHKPVHDFGCNFFDEWDYDQWNLCWNLVANCIQVYLQYGVVQAPKERLESRRLRQEITEPFILWADEYFSEPSRLNVRISRRLLFEEYCKEDPNARKFTSSTTEFKRRIIKYCQFRGYVFNPQKYDPATGKPCRYDRRTGNPVIDDKSGGVEFFTIGEPDKYYTTEEYRRLSETADGGDDDGRLAF